MSSWWVTNSDVLSAVQALAAKVSNLQASVNQLLTLEQKMAVDLSSITAEVTNNTSVTNSVVTLLNNLTAIIKSIPPSSDPTTQAALDQLTATLKANDTTIASAVTANTPSS